MREENFLRREIAERGQDQCTGRKSNQSELRYVGVESLSGVGLARRERECADDDCGAQVDQHRNAPGVLDHHRERYGKPQIACRFGHCERSDDRDNAEKDDRRVGADAFACDERDDERDRTQQHRREPEREWCGRVLVKPRWLNQVGYFYKVIGKDRADGNAAASNTDKRQLCDERQPIKRTQSGGECHRQDDTACHCEERFARRSNTGMAVPHFRHSHVWGKCL